MVAFTGYTLRYLINVNGFFESTEVPSDARTQLDVQTTIRRENNIDISSRQCTLLFSEDIFRK